MIIRLKTNLGGHRFEVLEDITLEALTEQIRNTLRIEGKSVSLSWDLEGTQPLSPGDTSLKMLNIKHGSELFLVGRYEKRVVAKPTIDLDGVLIAAGTTIVRVDALDNNQLESTHNAELVEISQPVSAVNNSSNERTSADTGQRSSVAPVMNNINSQSAISDTSSSRSTSFYSNGQSSSFSSHQHSAVIASTVPPVSGESSSSFSQPVDRSEFYYDGMHDEEEEESGVRAPDRAQQMTLIDQQPQLLADQNVNDVVMIVIIGHANLSSLCRTTAPSRTG